MTLNWESTYAIALELKHRHANVDLEDVTLGNVSNGLWNCRNLRTIRRSATMRSWHRSTRNGLR